MSEQTKPTHEPWDFVVSAKVGGYVVSRYEQGSDGTWSTTEFVASDKAGILRHLGAWLEERDAAETVRDEAERALKRRPE